jgi:hypothetical protein
MKIKDLDRIFKIFSMATPWQARIGAPVEFFNRAAHRFAHD